MADAHIRARGGFEQNSRYDPETMRRVVNVGLDEYDEDLDAPLGVPEGGVRDVRERGRGKRMFIAVLTMCAFVGIGVGIAMGVENSEDVKNLNAPENLSFFCSPSAVSTKKGYSKCESVCAQAECCRLPATDSQSCAEAKEDVCETFDAYCGILSFDHNNDGKVEIQEEVEVPHANSLLEKYCQWDNLASTNGFLKCKEACKPGNCCYEKIENCKVTNPDMCDSYAACEILHVQDIVTIPPALHNIDELCHENLLDDPESYNKCKAACDPGECCSEPIEACKVQNPEMCGGYEMCDILHGRPKSHPTSVESQVVTKCNTGALSSPEGIKECEDTCEPAQCCFTSTLSASNRQNSAPRSCNTKENEDWCSQYKACQTLEHIKDNGVNDHAEAQAAVKEACSDSSPDGLVLCSNVCAPAHCCFDGTQNCFQDGPDSLHCSDYDACGILYHHDKDPTTTVKPNPVAKDTDQASMLELAEHIEEVCDYTNIATPDGKDDCLNLCEDNLCCFAPGEYNCLQEHGELCVVYTACSSIVSGGSNSHTVESPKPPPANTDHVEKSPGFYDDIVESCSSDNLKTQDGFSVCHDMCKAHLCCFSPDQRENCYADHPLECDDYSPCANLLMPESALDDIDDTVEDEDMIMKHDVESVCSSTSLQSDDGFAACHAMCSDHLCCFSPGGTKSNCMNTRGADECYVYESCSGLITTDDGPIEMPSEPSSDGPSYDDKISQVCTEDFKTKNGDGDCEMLCTERECCFVDGPGNCQITDKEWCAGYELCLELDDIAKLEKEAEKDAFLSRCSQNWTAECTAMCEQKSCCLHDGVGSCAMTDPEWCDGTEMCPPLEDEDKESSSADFDDLADACSDSSLKTKEGIQQCHSYCKSHLCCSSVDDKNCYSDHPEECDYYMECDNLTNVDDTKTDEQNSGDESLITKRAIDEICLGSSIATTGGLTTCHAACSKYLCCFSPIGTKSNCEDEVGEEICYKYSSCSNLLIADKVADIKKDVSNFVDECSMDTIMEKGESACDKLCSDRKCCAENNGANCVVSSEGYCDDYALCANLDKMDNEAGGNDNGAGGNDNEAGGNDKFVDDSLDVMKVCTEENIGTAKGSAECRDACDPYQCCWTMIEENDCSAEIPECVLYTEPCQNLGGVLAGTGDVNDLDEPEDFDPSGYAETLEVLCSETSLQTEYGLETCQEACVPHSCCFTNEVETNCGDDPNKECKTYHACKNLHDFEGTVTKVESATSDEIQEVNMSCDTDNLNKYGTSQCEHHCDKRACCFTDNTQHGCYDEEKSWCDEYLACKNLNIWQPPTSDPEPEPKAVNIQEELELFCNESALAKDKGKTCLAACEPNECCYVHGAKSCYEGNEQLCSQFQICKNLFTAIP